MADKKKISIWLDGDPGHDDAMAMVMALASSRTEVLGMSVVAGNSTLRNTSTNAIRVLQWLGEDIDVVKGAAQPIWRQLEIADSVHGESGLDGPVFPENKREAVDRNCFEMMRERILAAEGNVTIVAMGPLTNIAIFLLSNPDLKSKIDVISLMGGAAIGGNWAPSAEFNIWEDAEAAKVVFNSGIPVIMCGLDATNKARPTDEDVAAFHALNTRGGDLVGQLMDFFTSYIPGTKLREVPMHDAVAVAAVLYPEVMTLQKMNVDVDVDGALTQGCTVSDIDGKTGKISNALVAMDLNREAFLEKMKQACAHFE